MCSPTEAAVSRPSRPGCGADARRRDLVANVGDAGVETVVERLADRRGGGRLRACRRRSDAPAGYLRASRTGYGRRGTGDAAARSHHRGSRRTTLELHGLDPLAGRCHGRLATAGRHNAANALGSRARPPSLGVRPARSSAGWRAFGGVGRRLERKGEAAGVVVYDDYGHHPTAIRETLAAVRQREPGRRVWAVYEPLTYHRTAALLAEFADVLADGRRRRRSRTSGPAAIRTRRSPPRRASPRRRRRNPGRPSPRPARSRRPPNGSREVRPATPSS